MKPLLFLAALTAFVVPACFVYDDSLVDDDGVSSGGSVSSGGLGSGGGSTPSGGSSSGGTGSGGDGVGGSLGGEGGAPVGGTGGSTGEVVYLVNDMKTRNPAYGNPPFFGRWARYDDASEEAAWANTNVTAMIQEDPEDASNFALHVKGTGFVDWGAGVYLSLQDSGVLEPIDLSSYDGVRFRARAGGSTEVSIKFAFEDDVSRRPDCLPANCDKHAAVVPPPFLTTDWELFDFELKDIVRSPALNLTEVYALHFTMNPKDVEDLTGTVDFWIDDIAFYKKPK